MQVRIPFSGMQIDSRSDCNEDPNGKFIGFKKDVTTDHHKEE
jgi:hypothetical protein